MKDILDQFKKYSRDIWKSPLIDKIDFKVVIRKQKNMMSLGYSAKPVASLDVLYKVPTDMTLYISERAMKLPKSQFQELLKHEVIHIGHYRHDESFRRVAKKYNIPMTVSQSEDGGYRVQVKEGSRYSTVKTLPSMESAREFAHRLLKSKKYGKIRIQY